MNDEELFVLLLEASCFSQEESIYIYENFKNFRGSMAEFVEQKLSNKCQTPFLFSTLKKFATAYDDLSIRKSIESVADRNCNSIKGDLHIHTNWSDGNNSVEEIVETAKTMGYQYIAITDHSLVAKGKVEMNEEKFMRQIKKINDIQKFYDIKIIKGIEIDINIDNSLDYSDEIIKNADLVIGSVHFDYGYGEAKAFKLLEELLKNEWIDIIAHPLNEIGKELFLENYEKILYLTEQNHKILEINLSPNRIEEDDFLVKIFNDSNIMFSFGTDSHTKKQMKFMNFSNLWNISRDRILNYYDEPLKILNRRRQMIL